MNAAWSGWREVSGLRQHHAAHAARRLCWVKRSSRTNLLLLLAFLLLAVTFLLWRWLEFARELEDIW